MPVRYEQEESVLLTIKDNQSKTIVTMTNNSKGYSSWEEIVGKGRLLPAFPSAAGCIQDGILHSQFGTKAVQPNMFGEKNVQITERVRAMENLFNTAMIPYSLSKDMDSLQKTHVAFNIALSKYLYSGDELRERSAVTCKESFHNMNLDIKYYLSLVEKASINITTSKLKIILKCPVWLMDLVMRYIFNTKIASNALFGGHAGNVRNELKLMEKYLLIFYNKTMLRLRYRQI